MAVPINVSRYHFYLRIDAPEGPIVGGVFRRDDTQIHFRVLHSRAESASTGRIESVHRHRLAEYVLQKWHNGVGVDLAKSAARALEGIPDSEVEPAPSREFPAPNNSLSTS